MVLYHITPKRNLDAILANGLQPEKSQGIMPVLWLCTVSKVGWAFRHVGKHHGVSGWELAILQVKIPRSRVSRRRRGVWITTSRITPDRLFLDFTGSVIH